jgi:hypothetical protein
VGPESDEFATMLQAVVAALDPSLFASLPVRDAADEGEPIPLLGDALHSFVGAVVAAGRIEYERARQSPASVLDRTWDFGEADRLLELGAPAVIAGGSGWLRTLVFGAGAGAVPDAYPRAVEEIAADLNERAEWQAWWSAAGGLPFLEVVIELGDEDEDTGSVRRGLAQYRFPIARLRRRSAGVVATLAAEDVTRILEDVRRVRKLGPLPPVPTPAAAEPIAVGERDRAARIAQLRASTRERREQY